MTRVLHLSGTVAVMLLLVICLVSQSWLLLWVLPLCGYGFAWVAHAFVERNRPATFTHPLYSLMGDFRMSFDILRYRRLHFERRIESQTDA